MCEGCKKPEEAGHTKFHRIRFRVNDNRVKSELRDLIPFFLHHFFVGDCFFDGAVISFAQLTNNSAPLGGLVFESADGS